MEKTRIAIIGTGGISRLHAAGYKTIPDIAEIVACCDIDEAKAQQYAKDFNIPKVYTDYNEMLEKEKIDAVSVCTWNSVHKDATVAALKAGANVLCEKPTAMNTAEALEMQKAAEDAGKVLQIGFVRRFGRDAEEAKAFLNKETFGDIYYTKASYLRRNGCPGRWFGDKEYSGGGPLIDLGVHVIDLVRYLSGSPKAVSVYGVTYNNLGCNRNTGAQYDASGKYKYNVEDFADAMIRFDNGMTLQIEASFNLNLKTPTGAVELYGTKAGMSLNPCFEVYSTMNGAFTNITPTDYPFTRPDDMFNAEMQSFINCVRTGCECEAPIEAGVELMRIIDAIYESAATGHEAIVKR